MLTSIEAKNFKCFGRTGVRLELAPLTILVGPNGSGKSSVFDAIALLAQSAETSSQYSFKWQGNWVDFGGDGRYALHKRDQGAELAFAVGISNGQGFAQWQQERGLVGTLERVPTTLEYFVSTRVRSEEWFYRLTVDGKVMAERRKALASQEFYSKQYEESVSYPILPETSHVPFKPTSTPVSPFSSGLFQGSAQMSFSPEISKSLTKVWQNIDIFLGYIAHTLASRVFILGADRALREGELLTPPDKFGVGKRAQYTLALLSIIFAQPEHAEQADQVRYWSGIFGLENLSGGWTGQQRLEAGYYDSKSRTPLPTYYAGFGSQQILPVIVQIFAAPRNSTILIEEPEISLHPEAQVELIKMFGNAVRAGRQIVITTHSQTLLLALSQAASQYGLKPTDIAIYHFSREQEETTVKRLELDTTFYIKGWVPSFSDVEKRMLKQWVTIVGTKLENET